MTKTTKPTTATSAAAIADLTAITHDADDAMRLAADLFAMTTYRAQRVMSAAAGLPPPRAPKPRSKYMRGFVEAVTAKLTAIAGLFDADEVERLKKIGGALADRLERNDPELMEDVLNVLFKEPEEAVEWIRDHLDEFETRFAS
jgi:hypothetical protein